MQGSHSNYVSYFQKYYYFIIDQLSHLKCKIIEASKTRTFQKCAFTHHQKVGEEAVEVVIEAKDDNDDLFLSESADLLFHYLILLQAKGFQLNDVVDVLKKRQK